MIILMASIWTGYLFNRKNGDLRLKSYNIHLELIVFMTFVASSFSLMAWLQCTDEISRWLFVLSYFVGLTLIFVLILLFILVPSRMILIDFEKLTKEEIKKNCQMENACLAVTRDSAKSAHHRIDGLEERTTSTR